MTRRILIGGLSVGVLALTAWMQAATPATVVEAAMSGNRDSVRAMLKDGADVNTAQADGMTALHWAATKNDVDLAKLLLVAGANLKAATRIGGYTPLLIASRSGHADMVTALLAAGSDPNAATANGATPLMFAAQAGSVPTVNALLKGGADVNAAEKVKGETALFCAKVGVKTKVMDLDAFNKEETAREDAFRKQQQAAAVAEAQRAGRPAPPEPQRGFGRGNNPNAKPGIDRQYNYTELVGFWGGLTPLHLAARQGEVDAAKALIDAGADLNDRSAGDNVTPMLIATINGHFDLAKFLLDHGGDPNAPAVNGVTPMYAALNCQWAAKALYPQPRAYEQQQATYLDLMKALLDKGADPNVRLTRKVWYAQYDFDQSGIDEAGATPFWRAAYASDVDAMKLLVKYGADPTIPTMRTPGRPRTGDATRETQDVSGLPPVSVGGPGVAPLLAASGEGYGEGLAANHHRYAPTGMLPAVKYLVEELHVDVNVRDHEGNNAVHNAASRGDNEMIQYLVSKGGDPLVVNREGKTTVDMANGPVQRITPFPETIKLLEGMGAKNNHKCVGC